MTHFELEPIPCESDGHEGFPLSFKIYDTFRGRVYLGTILYMTNLKVYRATSVYASADEVNDMDGLSIESTKRRDGDVHYDSTSSIEEAKKLYRMYCARLTKKERIARIFDTWWPSFVSLWAIPGTILVTMGILEKIVYWSN